LPVEIRARAGETLRTTMTTYRTRIRAWSRGWIGSAAVAVLCLAPLLPWALAHPPPDRFATPATALKSLANVAALVGTAAFAVALLLGSRLRVIGRLFLGLDRMYRAHRWLGLAAVALVTAHALLLLLGRALSAGASALTLLTPGAGWGVFVGVVALAGLLAGVAVTVFAGIRHETFVVVQRALGFVFVVASVHVFAVPGTKASSWPLTVYLGLLTALAVAAFARRSLFERSLIRRHRYRVRGVRRLATDAVEIVLAEEGDAFRFRPGQFVFVRFMELGGEAHPFTIASAPHEATVRLVVKALGDHTWGLVNFPPGGAAELEGPYGSFSQRALASPRQVWIAGGIGITPFLSMARSLDGAGREIDLYYCMQAADRAYFLDELFELADRNPRFRVIPIRKRFLGHLTADDIELTSRDLRDKDVLICGPPVMTRNLIGQLRRRGVPRARIHYEDFGFRS
jgi:predicted ferric reductase